jgi:hypothetical protein
VLYSFILSTLIIVKSDGGTDGGVETASQMAAALGRGGREHDAVKNIYDIIFFPKKEIRSFPDYVKGGRVPHQGLK